MGFSSRHLRALLLSFLTLFLPGIALADGQLTGNTNQTLTDVIHTMTNTISDGVAYLFLLLIFYWNIYQVIASSNNPEKRKQALPRLLWSIIVLAVVFSLAGLINLVVNTVLGTSLSSHAPASTGGTSGSTFTTDTFTVTPPPQVELTTPPPIQTNKPTIPDVYINQNQ